MTALSTLRVPHSAIAPVSFSVAWPSSVSIDMNSLETDCVSPVMVLKQLWNMAGRYLLEGTGHTL